jgi:flagellum-specific peptidoglycan hydrolase FlgJ
MKQNYDFYEVGDTVELDTIPKRVVTDSISSEFKESDKIPWWSVVLIVAVIFFYNQGKVTITNTDNYDGRTDAIYTLEKDRPSEVVEFRARNVAQQKQVDFIKHWLPIAKVEYKKYKIPVSIILAQGIVESTSGTSDVCKRLNNYFGVMRGNEYRMYLTAWASFRHHSEVLSGDLYKDLHGKDYKGWAIGLQKKGYATDKHYADTLINVIERWGLQRYDSP